MIDFLIDFWSILGPTWDPTSIQNRSKIDHKIINFSNDFCWSIFHRLLDCWSMFSSSWRGRGLSNIVKTNGFSIFCVFCLMLCWNRFWSIFNRFRGQLGSQNQPKIDQTSIKKLINKNHWFFDRFVIDFWSILGPKLGPSWGQVGAKIDQKEDAKWHAKKYG